MEMKQLVESIIRELVGTMQAQAAEPPPKVLYIFCDSTAHEAYRDHFILLQKNGIQYDRLFLDGVTSGWLGMHKVESSGLGRTIAVDESAPAPIEIPMGYDGIVIPEIDVGDAGRVALGMKGTVRSEIIFAALVMGKFVVVGDDSSGLSRSDRRTLKELTLPMPYQKLFSYYKSEMHMYGVDFAPAQELAEWVVKRVGGPAARIMGNDEESTAEAAAIDSREDATATTAAAELSEHQARFEGKFLSADWVNRLAVNKRITVILVKRGTILSPLARDVLREKGIVVQIRDEG
ncbi:hypothetical protein [Paenibacillus sp. CF384]|uniref:hypothetical protein n=1 Tax=Paenibacillus sp. CF384 TaxID=1884382 RepID=UPI000897AC64|nr:hypothetical protein [Paenibacillus sp. CF384]SDX08606.1 hypothetical protein SAMN05518855_1008227 [Paenibacillus sp. CF384]